MIQTKTKIFHGRPQRQKVCVILLAFLIPSLLLVIYLRATLVYAINASHSLEAPGFALVTWPAMRSAGTYISFNPPAEIDRGLPFIKRIEGVPGDVVRIEQGQSCLNDSCRTLTGEEPYFKTPTEAQIIPEGHYYVVGETDTSFDSRYAALGLISEDQIIASGWALPSAPEWEGRK